MRSCWKKTKKISKNVLTFRNGNDILRFVAEDNTVIRQQTYIEKYVTEPWQINSNATLKIQEKKFLKIFQRVSNRYKPNSKCLGKRIRKKPSLFWSGSNEEVDWSYGFAKRSPQSWFAEVNLWNKFTKVNLRSKFTFLIREFDPGSGWTLAACLTHASRTEISFSKRLVY